MIYPESVIEQSFAFFEKAHEDYLSSASHAGVIQRLYRVAGFTLCLKFAGDALVEKLTNALSHLEIESAETSDLTICIWDSSPLLFPWSSQHYDMRGEVIGYNTDRIHTVVDVPTKALNVLDRERNLALYWVRDLEKLPWWVSGSPLQLIIHWWMKGQGIQLTHAAAVGFGNSGVLLAGKGGSGKSTTTLACMKAGMKYVSEDYCLVSSLPDIWAHSIYNSAKLENPTLVWFPELGTHVTNKNRAKEEKAFLFHQKFQPEKILLSCRLKALLSLKIEKCEKSWMEPIGVHEALTALSISTLWQLTHTGPTVFNHLKAIAEKLPRYLLHLGSNPMQAPEFIGTLL